MVHLGVASSHAMVSNFDRRYTPFFYFSFTSSLFPYSSSLHFFPPPKYFSASTMARCPMSIHYYLHLFIWKFGGPRLRDMEARFADLFIFYHLHDM